jgi:hypothetical protein
LATLESGTLFFAGEILSPDGRLHWRREDGITANDAADAAALGRKLGAAIRAEAGEEFIQALDKRGW